MKFGYMDRRTLWNAICAHFADIEAKAGWDAEPEPGRKHCKARRIAAMKFKDATGGWPDWGWEFDRSGFRDDEVSEWLEAQWKAWRDSQPGAPAKDGQWRRHGSSGPPENLDPEMFGKKKRGRTSKRDRVFSDLPDDPMPWQEDGEVGLHVGSTLPASAAAAVFRTAAARVARENATERP